ncbi:hypothetical protein PM082_009801 [Marasmius tenuissimus]|nr:hypothetical protein PM082_009801 [Marasmius tenuissimus]
MTKKSNEKLIKFRLEYLRRLAGLSSNPAVPHKLWGHRIVNEGIYLATGSKGVRRIDDNRFKNLGRWFWFWLPAGNGTKRGRSLFEAERIPLPILLDDPELTQAIERRGSSRRRGRVIPTPTDSGEGDPITVPDNPGQLSTLTPSPSQVHLKRSAVSNDTNVSEDDDDDDIECTGANLRSDRLSVSSDDDDSVPDSDVIFLYPPEPAAVSEGMGKEVGKIWDRRLDASDADIAFEVVVFGWVADDGDPIQVAVPILRSDAGFLSLRSIMCQLGTIGIEIGDSVDRYIAGDQTWRRLKWSTPFPVKTNVAVALRLSSVTRMKDWEYYQSHDFSL